MLYLVLCGPPALPQPLQAGEKALVSRIFKNGRLSTEFFYGNDRLIDSIKHYNADNGVLWHTEKMLRGPLGRLLKKISVSQSTQNINITELSYHNGRLAAVKSYGQRQPGDIDHWAFSYPDAHTVAVKVSRKQGAGWGNENKTWTFRLDGRGNTVMKKTSYGNGGKGDYTDKYTYDNGMSVEWLIDQNIPGYFLLPVGRNNRISTEQYNESGQPVTSGCYRYKCEYNAGGCLVKYIAHNHEGKVTATYTYEYL